MLFHDNFCSLCPSLTPLSIFLSLSISLSFSLYNNFCPLSLYLFVCLNYFLFPSLSLGVRFYVSLFLPISTFLFLSVLLFIIFLSLISLRPFSDYYLSRSIPLSIHLSFVYLIQLSCLYWLPSLTGPIINFVEFFIFFNFSFLTCRHFLFSLKQNRFCCPRSQGK